MAERDLQPYKGVRDFYPEDMKIQNYIFDTWRKTVESFGYVEYSASILEPAELYQGKTSEEIVKEQTFIFKDRGNREVVLRPEMTPTLARMIAARRRHLKFPVRWYSIPNVFRYERPQRGRRREHWQLNCDLLGLAGMEAEIEIISLAHGIMKAFGAKDKDFEILVSSRKALPPGADMKIVRQIDKGKKTGVEVKESAEIKSLLRELAKLGIKNARFDGRIVRGFDYYTGTVFEVFDTHPDNTRALFGGGRYDNLLEMFRVKAVPAVGFGMGDIALRDFLETHQLPLCEK